jgi:photosystem II stability/assembly factor-like uncharacterized protein
MKHYYRIVYCIILISLLSCIPYLASGGDKEKKDGHDTLKSSLFSGLQFRSIGPAFTSGRIADFAVNPKNPKEYFVAVASGHIWKTINNGTTFEPVFDNYGSYAIGCVAMDPANPNVIWAGTGENNHQRSLGYGDGIYKSSDGGKSWTNMGLKESRQIGKILIDPRNSDIIYVAAEGSVWGPGGDRGLYKTTDGGTTWNKVLDISQNTGVNCMVMDPRNPDVIYASSEQRRRHIFTKIGGGPETAIYKTTDAGKTWRKLTSGLPTVDMGGIGLDVSPVNPDVVYAIIEAAENAGGFYRSDNRGESWEKMSDYTAPGQYYNEITCDPKDVNKVYAIDVVMQVTEDGGKTWHAVGNDKRHVDDHAIWIDAEDTGHLLIGGDGGIYESWDAGKNYVFKSNLPVTQFYRVNVDNTEPFYWVYGGTQDNSSLGGPSRNLSRQGVTSSDWIVTLGGDGFWQAVDPKNPDIVYSEYQYGNIYRYDKKSGENTFIKPQPRKGEDTYKWNWNTPFILSPHSNTMLYIAANKVFRSDDRGQSWQVISEDITAKIDRNTWPVMGQWWSIDAVSKDVSTSLYGTSVSMDESPVKEDLLYVGTDDGLIQITEDAGITWRKADKFPGIPDNTYVSDIFASRFDENIVFASFDNIQRDDFKPYILKSTDKGKSWESITGNLPQNGTVHTIIQDFIDPDLIFIGTEFGVFFTRNCGGTWTQLKSGIPAIAVRDAVIQQRECDLVLATFGRGFYILDNYAPLRQVKDSILDKDAYIFPIKDALMYIQKRGLYGQGSTVYVAKNPEFGATFTYYCKEVPKTLKQLRKEKEKDLLKEKKPVPIPSMDDLRKEDDEVKPYLVFTMTDEEGHEIRKLTKSPSEGINRITWNLHFPSSGPVRLDKNFDPLALGDDGNMVMPGTYNVTLSQVVRGLETVLAGPVRFRAIVLNNTTLPASDRAELVAFQKKVAELTRAVEGAERYTSDLISRIQSVKQAIFNTPGLPPDLFNRLEQIELQLHDLNWAFYGQQPKASQEENWPAPASISERLSAVSESFWSSTSAVSQTQRDVYASIETDFPALLDQLKKIGEVYLPDIENTLEKAGAPWTPGRIPVWKNK